MPFPRVGSDVVRTVRAARFACGPEGPNDMFSPPGRAASTVGPGRRRRAKPDGRPLPAAPPPRSHPAATRVRTARTSGGAPHQQCGPLPTHRRAHPTTTSIAKSCKPSAGARHVPILIDSEEHEGRQVVDKSVVVGGHRGRTDASGGVEPLSSATSLSTAAGDRSVAITPSMCAVTISSSCRPAHRRRANTERVP